MTPALPSPPPSSPPTNDPLAELRDIHLPEPISWWPLAPGWWLLLGMVIVLGVAIWWWMRWRKIQKAKPVTFSHADIIKAALAEFGAIDQHPDSAESTRQVVIDLSHLLRRCAMQLDASTAVAGLTGAAWLEWLDSRWDRDDFSQTTGHILIDTAYRQISPKPDDVAALFLSSHAWLEQQR